MQLAQARQESPFGAACARLNRDNEEFVIVSSTNTILWVYRAIDEGWYAYCTIKSDSLDEGIIAMNVQMAPAQIQIPESTADVWLPVLVKRYFSNLNQGDLLRS